MMGKKATFVLDDAAILEASKDPLFLADIREAQRDFEHADFEE